MSTTVKEWLKKEQKIGAYYLFEDKQVIGEKFFNALLKKRGTGFYIDDDSKKEGFMASVYGIYELLSISDNLYNESAQQKKAVSVADQISLANEIKSIYEHIDKYGFDFAPIISNSTNKKFFLKTEEGGSKNIRQKYPYFGAMTWILSLSSLLWKKYFSYTETGEYVEIDSKKEIITDQEAVAIIRSLENEIRDSIRHIIRLFVSSYIAPERIGRKLDLHSYGDDNRTLQELAAEDGLKMGWGYTKKVKNPSLYFTFSVLEAYSDFDSNILIGGDNDDYYFATDEEQAKGMETTKNISAYARNERFFHGLIDYINSDVKRDANGNIIIGADGKPERESTKGIRYEEEFRKAATQCAYYLFYKFKDTIADGFYNDDGYVVTRQQVTVSSSSPAVFYPLYILSSFLNGEVNGTIKTKMMYVKQKKNELLDIADSDQETLALIEEMDNQIKTLETEFRQFENCFTDGLNNVQKIYSLMEKNDKLDVIDRHYLTFDQTHPDDPQFSRMLSRENVLAMPLLPLLVNVTNLYVLWITKFPDKQLSAYIIDIFENYCNRDENSEELEWVFEQGSYDLHTTARYIDAISNFYSYYESYEKMYAVRSKALKDATAAVRSELEPQYREKLEKNTIEHHKEVDSLKKTIAELNKEISESDKKFNNVFNVENSFLIRLSEILDQYVNAVHSGENTPHETAIDAFVKAFIRVILLKISSNASVSDKYMEEFVNGLKYIFEQRKKEEENSLTNLFKNIVDKDKYIFLDLGQVKSDQD